MLPFCKLEYINISIAYKNWIEISQKLKNDMK